MPNREATSAARFASRLATAETTPVCDRWIAGITRRAPIRAGGGRPQRRRGLGGRGAAGRGVRFPAREDRARDLPGHLEARRAWLRAHAEAVPAGPPEYVVAEEIAVAGDFESGDDVGFYTPDTVPPTPEEVERYLRIAGHAHTDLLALVEPLDGAALDWVRGEHTRPIRRVLRHIVGAELWYMTRIIDDPKAAGLPEIIRDADERCDATEDMMERVRIAWSAFPRRARSPAPGQRG